MGRSKNYGSLLLFACAVIPLVFPASQSYGQGIEEIIVTTRRKEENLQEIPLAVTVIGADAIERQGITNMFKIAELDPSVSFDTAYGPADTRVAIRGLSNTRGRSNVAFLVDGVDVTTENQIAAGSGLLANQRLLTDVERIEIVKGPQSALYGRAAFAGAIAYTTKNPTDTLTGNVGVDYGTGETGQLKGSVSGPINDTLGFRLDGVGWSSNGFYNNAVSGGDLGSNEGWAGSGTLRWEPSDTFDLKARMSYSDDEGNPRPTALMPGDSFVAYPEEMIDAGIGVGNPDSFPRSIGLVNHGTYCPDLGVWNDGNPNDPNFGNTLPGVAPGTPGICLPGNYGSVSDLPQGQNSLNHSETLFGDEQPGYTLDMFRASLNMNWDISVGTLSFIGGYTDANQTDVHDQDFQAYQRPDLLGQNDPFLDLGATENLANQQADTETDTRLISGEIRFATNFEGPVNATVGFLSWDLKVSTEDRNYIANCIKTVGDATPGNENWITGLQSVDLSALPGGCDGGNAITSSGITGIVTNGTTLKRWQPYMQQLLVTDATAACLESDGISDCSHTVLENGRLPGAVWQSDTDHKSIYAQLEWNISDTLKLTPEVRYVDEKFTILRPNQASCAEIATVNLNSAGGTGPAYLSAWYEEGTGNLVPPFLQPVPDLNCSSVTGESARSKWKMIEGSEDSDFWVPKVTLEWFATDTDMIYFSWAKAQKPGGIGQLAAGGSAVSIEDLRFDPEKMTTWELGSKTMWEFGGTLVANGALFFNDYTDKQVNTQVLVNGVSSPRVENAAGAEVKGMEIDLNWFPSALEGFNIRLAYTYQDAKYTDYTEFTQAPPRAAMAGSCPVFDNDPGPDENFGCNLDLSGNALERQAKNAFSGNFGYVRPLPGSTTEWFLEGDAVYSGKRYLDQDNFVYWDSYWLFNFRTGMQTDRWDVTVFLDNAFDDDTIRTGGSGPDFGLQTPRLGFTAGFGTNGFFGIFPDPRTVGVRTNFRFGD
jgi:outer membrane receptor protein involved in Fe transport